jgi:putative DNA base modification enzyme with NMAD domain
MNVVLLRVGIDTGSGGALGPVFSDGSFEFIPIPDGFGMDTRTYGNTVGRHGRCLADYLPASKRHLMRHQPMHVDPEFDTFTYGDPTPPKAGLRRLVGGDLLVFYAGLKGYDCLRPPALYIVGYFEVALAGLASELGPEIVQHVFGANFHVMHPAIYADQRDRLVLVKGSSSSRLLTCAAPISEVGVDRAGRPVHVLSQGMREVFGDFGGHVAIQRSPPRWVAPEFVVRARDFVRSL